MSIKISELPQATSVTSSDVVPIVQNGTTKKVKADLMNLDVYSTTEQRVGTWIDGKPLYRIVLKNDSVPISNDIVVISASFLASVDTIASIRWFVGTANSAGVTGRSGYLNTNYYSGVQTNASNISIYLKDGSNTNIKYLIIVEYTKTTDTATRTLNLTRTLNTIDNGEIAETKLATEQVEQVEQVKEQVENISEEKQEEKINEAEPIETKTEGSGDSK